MRTAKLKDITLTITDGKHGDCKNHDGSGYYFISCKDVYDETIHYENARQITEDDFRDADRRTNLAAYDILITNSGTIGRMALVKDIPETRKTTFQKSVAIVRADTSQVVPNYLYYLLKSKVHDFINSSNGSAQKNLLLSTMREFDISFVDSFETQHRIANILSRYDSLIENYQKQIKLLEEAAQRLYKEWFVDLHFPGHENTKIVDGLPEGWEKKKVGDIAPIITGKKDANFGTPDGEYPFFTCSQEPIKAPSFSFDCAAVLLSGNGDFNVKLYRGKFEAYQRTYVLSPCCAQHLYLLYYTISANMTKLAAGSSGSTIKFLTKGMIDGINLNVPNYEILESFNKKVEPIQSSRESLQSQLRLLTEARDRLLPKLMSGEITV